MDFSNEGYRESGFQGNLLAPASHFAPLEMAYYFRTVRMQCRRAGMHSFVQEQHMCIDKNVGGSGMGDKPCKTASFWVFGAPKRRLIPSRLACRACWCTNSHVTLFCTSLSQYLSVGELTVGW